MHDTSTQPHGAARPDQSDYRYISLNSLGLDPEQLDFYQLLLACRARGEAEESLRQVVRFRTDDYGKARFIGSLDALPALLATFPLWRAELEGWSGELAREELLARASGLLGQPVGAFLASAGWRAALPDIWQTLLVLGWRQAGSPADAALAAQLTDVLRVVHFLQVLEGNRAKLDGQGARCDVLGAHLLWPAEGMPLPR